MSKFFLHWLLLFAPGIVFSQQPKETIVGKFVGFWAETRWTYSFGADSTFIFETEGHFGNTHTQGLYKLSGDTVIITAFGKDKQRDSDFLAIIDTLLIDGDSCIIHFSIGYDYCKQAEKAEYLEHSRQRRKSRHDYRKPDEE